MKPLLKSLIIVFVLLSLILLNANDISHVAAATSGSVVLYVDGVNGNDAPSSSYKDPGNLCDKAAAPCKTIQRAFNVYARKRSTDGIQSAIIKVGQGIYPFDESIWYNSPDAPNYCKKYLHPDEISIGCLLDPGGELTLIGGFVPGYWDQPVGDRETTIIDGGGTYRGIHLVALSKALHFRLSNITIQNSFYNDGFLDGTDPTSTGGGMYSQGATVEITDTLFRDNVAQGMSTSQGAGGPGVGGGIGINGPIVGSRTSSFLRNVDFENNKALGGSGPERGGLALGGGLFTVLTNVTVEDIELVGNLSQAGSSNGSGFADGIYADALGGGAAFMGEGGGATEHVIDIKNIYATNNKTRGGNANGKGGGAFGGGVFAENDLNFSMVDSEISANISQSGNGYMGGFASGGGMELGNTNATLNNVKITNNLSLSGDTTGDGKSGTAVAGGASFPCYDGKQRIINLTNTIIADNRIQHGNGPVHGGGGAGIVLQGVVANIKHTTFANNRLGDDFVVGHAIQLMSHDGSVNGTPGIANIENSIFSDHVGVTNAATIVVFPGSTLNMKQGLFANNTKETNQDGIPLPTGTFNGLNTIQRVATIDYLSPGYPSFDYHIKETSAAVDIAVVSSILTDIDGNPRPYGNGPDFGADEFRKPEIVVSQTALAGLLEENSDYERVIDTSVSFGEQIYWTASTNADWIYLGANGTSKTAAGWTGDPLPLLLSSQAKPLGVYEGTITLLSDAAELPITIPVTMVVTDEIHHISLPVLMR